MQPPQILVLSDPPHGDVDVEAVAGVLGLAISDARLKLEFSAPEVLSSSNHHRASEIADALTAAGTRVAVVDGQRLVKVPWPTLASSVEFGSDALVARVGDDEVRLAYDAPVVAVSCRPPADFRPPTTGSGPRGERETPREGSGLAEAVEWLPHVDLYFEDDRGKPRRLCVAPGLMEGASGAAPTGGSGAEEAARILAESAQHFTCLQLDDRLDGVRPRQRFVMGEQGFDIDLRKLYSFGTLLLRQALDAISPELKDLTQYEFASRISYVLRWGDT